MTHPSFRVTGPAALALALWIAPAEAGDVNVGINIGVPAPPAIVIAAPPQLAVVPGSPVFYAPALEVNFFSYGGRYYTYSGGAWFMSRHYRGPWSYVAVAHVPPPVLAVPVAYYRVPPGHVKKFSGGPPHGNPHGNKGHKGRD